MNQASPCLRLHVDDNILVARVPVPAGTPLAENGAQSSDSTREPIEMGHKVASCRIEPGQPVRKYGQVIGFATEAIESGEWVHTHNLEPGSLDLDYAFASEVPDEPERIEGRMFEGYRRNDGRVGTRNYLGIISTVNCSATASKYVARAFDEGLLEDYPNIDGIVAIAHTEGGERDRPNNIEHILRTLGGFTVHPNVGDILAVDYGTESVTNAMLERWIRSRDLPVDEIPHAFYTITSGLQTSLDEASKLIT